MAIGLSLASASALLVFYLALSASGTLEPGETARAMLVVASSASLVTMLVAREVAAFRISQAVRYATGTLVIIAGVVHEAWGIKCAELLYFCTLVLELSLLEEYPRNTVCSVAIVTATLLLRLPVWLAGSGSPGDGVWSLMLYAIPGYGVALLGSQMVRFREAVVELQRDTRFLQEVVANMARANTRYQSVAVTAGEKGRFQERRRITRDIHDIVGYTLTNNIMLMETAIDMMRENPLGVPKLIESARANAKEGLTRIREALYDLRRQEDQLPLGSVAVQRLALIFGEATGVSVRLDWANAPATFVEAVDSALYHLVQESLINSYRHGKATSVDISFSREEDLLNVRVRDDGVGAAQIREGIGISGMRERVEMLGGELVVSSTAHGFLVRASIPLGESANDGP
jgi:signal transduction histidine kinase